ncbi:hypothetical protein PQX77_007091, partial [Marasmius sp. AFHP31]
CREPPLPPPAYVSLSTSKPVGQQEAFSVLPSENPSPSPPNPPTSTVPLVVVLEIISSVTLSSSPMPTNSTHRCFAVSSVQSLSTSHNTRLEIHALGIGSGVSTSICQDIALAGNGVCLFAVEAEDIFISCIGLLAAG